MEKTCCRCKEPLPIAEFQVRRSAKDGLNGSCRKCESAYYLAWRKSDKGRESKSRSGKKHYRKNRDKILEAATAFRRSEEGQRKRKAYEEKYKRRNPEAFKRRQQVKSANYIAKYPERKKAVLALNNAVRFGRIKREPCQECGSTHRVEGHHEDYSKPLDVIWLCGPCHRALHAQKREQS